MKSVRISEELFNAATAEAAKMHRSAAGQLEHWIHIGRSAESKLNQQELRALIEHTPKTA